MTVDDFLKLVKSADSDKRLKSQKFSSFSDSFRYAEMRSEIIGQLMEQNILDLNDRETACLLTLKEQYAPINSVCGQVQRSLDRKTGLHLTPQKADFPLERVMTLAHSLTDPTVPDETIQRRARSGTENIIISIHDDYIEENAKFRTKAGIKCYITRTTDGKCCPWCTSIAGRYEYGKEPSDIYSRHDNCTCSVTFENGRERQDVWSKRKWEVKDEFQPKVFSRQQAERIQEQNLNRGLTNWENSGKIELRDDNEEIFPVIVDNVPKLNYFSDENLNIAVEESANSIIKEAKKYMQGTEFGVIISAYPPYSASDLIMGEEGAMAVKIPRCNSASVTLHNHPSGKSFSAKDIDRFVIDENSKTMCVIGNNGNWYVLEKNSDFDWFGFQLKVLKISKEENFAELILQEAETYGFTYYKKNN